MIEDSILDTIAEQVVEYRNYHTAQNPIYFMEHGYPYVNVNREPIHYMELAQEKNLPKLLESRDPKLIELAMDFQSLKALLGLAEQMGCLEILLAKLEASQELGP